MAIEAARREFKRVVDSGKITATALIYAAQQYRDSKPGQFTKQAEKWLRDGHYADEQPEAEPDSSAKAQPRKPPFRNRQSFSDIDLEASS